MRQIHCQRERGKHTKSRTPKERWDLERWILKSELPPAGHILKDKATASDPEIRPRKANEGNTHQVWMRCNPQGHQTVRTLRVRTRHAHLNVYTTKKNISILWPWGYCDAVHFHNCRHKWRKDPLSLVLWAKWTWNEVQAPPCLLYWSLRKILLVPFRRKADSEEVTAVGGY